MREMDGMETAQRQGQDVEVGQGHGGTDEGNRAIQGWRIQRLNGLRHGDCLAGHGCTGARSPGKQVTFCMSRDSRENRNARKARLTLLLDLHWTIPFGQGFEESHDDADWMNDRIWLVPRYGRMSRGAWQTGWSVTGKISFLTDSFDSLGSRSPEYRISHT